MVETEVVTHLMRYEWRTESGNHQSKPRAGKTTYANTVPLAAFKKSDRVFGTNISYYPYIDVLLSVPVGYFRQPAGFKVLVKPFQITFDAVDAGSISPVRGNACQTKLNAGRYA